MQTRDHKSMFLGVDTQQIYKGDPRPRIPPRVMASSAIGHKLGVFGFLPTTHAKQTQRKCFHNLNALCRALHVFIFTLRE